MRSSVYASYLERQVVAVQGCGAMELYVCFDQHKRHEPARICTRFEDLSAQMSNRLVCRNGGALTASGMGEAVTFTCGAPRPPRPDTTETCTAACDRESCAAACSGSDALACHFECLRASGTCRDNCVTAPPDALEAPALCQIGLCAKTEGYR